MIIDKINQYLTSEGMDVIEPLADGFASDCQASFTRQFGATTETTTTLRLSSIGSCIRQQAYKVKGFEPKGKEIDSRAKVVFLMGDLTEAMIVHLAALAGCHITDQQKEVEINGVKGHIDGLYNGRLVEIKSMSSYSFSKLQKGEINESYIYQYNAYLDALGLDEVIYIGLNKDAGVLGEYIFHKDLNIVRDIKIRINALQNLNGRMPKRPFEPNDKGFLPWQCLYCSYWGHCYPEAEKVLVSKAYKLKVSQTKQEAGQ